VSELRFVDEHDGMLGWIDAGKLRRTSHALVEGGRVWLVDPVDGDGLDTRIRALGEPAGVIQLLDRHERDSAALAARYGVPLHVVPKELPGSPFELRGIVDNRLWREAALWWPERRVLVCADALGTLPYFRTGADAHAGVHPMLRLFPPRSLAGLEPRHLLVGHGAGLHGDVAAEALRESLRTARRRFPRWLAGLPKRFR
jgi:hypothetical protein